MNDDLEQLLKSLHLSRIAEILDEELPSAPRRRTLPIEKLLARLLRAAVAAPPGERARLAHQAAPACPSSGRSSPSPSSASPASTQRQIRTFAELDFIPKAENIVFIGPTGVGKTGLASGLLLKALQNGHRGALHPAQDLFDEMYASLADRSSRKLLNRLARVDVLVIDEMAIQQYAKPNQ